jgi:HD superfamily phosphohydrolase
VNLQDSVFGSVTLSDPAALDIIGTATFQRLRRVHQAGPSALVFPRRVTTRFDHSIGVYLLLQRMAAPRVEQIAGLLHDISHTAFSHVVDVLFPSPEQNFHENHKPAFLRRADLREALERHAMAPEDFDDDTRFGLLEQPLPALCADRIDYFLRDGLTSGVVSASFVAAFLSSLKVQEGRLVSTDRSVAREAARLFARVDRELWSSLRDRHIYTHFSAALRVALDRGVLGAADLFEDDAHVIQALERSAVPEIHRLLETMHRDPSSTEGPPLARGKKRWLDPTVCEQGRCQLLSTWDAPTADGG